MSTSTLAPVVETSTSEQISKQDRCDHGYCGRNQWNPHGIQAWVRVLMPSGDLFFCNHHAKLLAPALIAKGGRIIDESHRINEKPSESSPV